MRRPLWTRLLGLCAPLLVGALLASGATSSGAAAAATTRSSSPTARAGPAGSWLAYGGDPVHSGNARGEPPAATLVPDWTASTNGQVFAEPLVDRGRVIVATENDAVYSLDESRGTVQWITGLGTPVPKSGICGNIDPSGITGTPVIDRPAGLVLAVAYVEPGVHQLVALDLATGRVRWREPITLPGVDPLAQQQRSALALDRGRVYIAFGGVYGDCGNYRGFIVSFPATNPGTQTTFAVPTHRAGFWAPPGPIVTGDGTIYAADGNGTPSTTFDDSDAVLAFSPRLSLKGIFAPSNWTQLDQNDLDLGSTSPALVAGHLFQIGKAGVGYLLDPAHLGGVGGAQYSAPVCPSQGVWGATTVAGDVLYVPCAGALTALRVGPGARFRVLWSQPSLTQAAAVVAGGKLWVATRRGQVAEVDPATGRVGATQVVGAGASDFPDLSVADGRLFVPAGNTVVALGGV